MRHRALKPLAALALVGMLHASDASAYRAIYNGHFLEYGEFLFNPVEDQQLLNEILWLAGPGATMPVQVCVLDSIGTDAFWYSVLWDPFTIRHPGQVQTIRAAARPVTEAYLEATGCEVAVLSNAWHGPPALVPPPNPGGGDWAYTAAEGAQIANWLDNRDAGLLLTAGSFGQFAANGPDTNYNTFASTLGVVSTNGGTPGCIRSFPWSRNTGCYPPTRTASQHLLLDPGHPVAASIPGAYGLVFTTAAAVWMETSGATKVGLVTVGGPEQSLTTAFESQQPIEVTVFDCRNYPFKGHPTVCWIEAENLGAGDVDLASSGLTFGGAADGWRSEMLQFGMDDTNGTPGLDPGGTASWTVALTLPLGPPDGQFGVSAKVCASSGCGSKTLNLISDSCKHNTAAPGDSLDEYRHYQKAVIFIRTAWRNGDSRVGEALDLLRQDTDDAFQRAHTLVSNTSPGPGAYNLELIHENLDEGNCQFGVTGAWLRGL